MHQMPIDIEQGRAIGLDINNMIVPDFIIERASFGH
jgi:hypothetical protein